MYLKKWLYWFWKFISEKQLRGHYRKHYQAEILYFQNYKEKKPKTLMNREMRALKKYWGCYPFQYIRYGMYKKSCRLTITEMKNYIPNYFAYYLFFPKHFKDYGIITEDKELTFRLFDSYKVNQPNLLFQYKNGVFYDKGKEIILEKDVDSLIEATQGFKIFLKPTHGLGGKGILVFNKKDHFFDKQNNKLSASYIKQTLGKNDNYVVQEGLLQHDELNKIYPNSVNTFRIMTAIEDGKSRILFAMLRMGQGGNQIDNASQMGLVCRIDISTGAFDSSGYTGLGAQVDKHPDTGFAFKGYTFPYWDSIRSFIITTAQKIDTIKYIGWDIAFTDKGPAVIEMNAGAGLEFLQDCHGGVREAYGILNPKDYWFNEKYVIKDL